MPPLSAEEKTFVRNLHADLVRIPSVNEGQAQADETQAERAVADYVDRFCREIGMTVTRFPFAPGRDNLVAHWPDQTGQQSFALQAHMDTVSVAGMTVAPFDPIERDGRIYGRGTCDTKGSLAAFLAAARSIADRRADMIDKFYIVATVAEETGCKGAERLMADGFRTDAIVVGEPTSSRVVSAHKGTYWTRIEVAGKSCHASMPHLGQNAIYFMNDAIAFMRREFIPSLAEAKHGLLGSPTLSVGIVSGGTAVNIVPDRCTADLDFRVLPGQSFDDLRDQFLARLRTAVPDAAFTLNDRQRQSGMETSENNPFLRNTLSIAAARTNQSKPEGVNYFADSGPFAAAGIPCILFGPGDIAQAHTADEFLALDELYRAYEIARDWLQTATRKSLFS